MTDSSLQRAQSIIDRAQVDFFKACQSVGNDELSAWFSACLNSACGPIAEKIGHAGVAALLKVWSDDAADKAATRDARVR